MSFARFNNSSSFKRYNQPKKAEEQYDINKVNGQIENARTRIQSTGHPVEDADSRNWFEKLTNLPEHQNAFFDTLELLFRPGQAVVSGVGAANDGGNFLEGAHKGFSGQDRTRGADLAEDWGVENKVGKFILGTALDIGLDPLTYVPGGVLLRGAKAGAKIAGKGAKGAYQAAEKAVPSFARFSENQLKPAAESTKDALGYMFKRDYKAGETLQGGQSDFLKNLSQETDDARHFMQEESLKNVADAAKLAGGVDTGLEVGRAMESSLKQYDEKFKLLDGNLTDDPDVLKRMISDREAAIRTKTLPDDQIHKLTSEIDTLKSSLENPEKTLLARPERELASDPRISEAAAKITQSDNALRDYATENGIAISELEGYMTHVWSKAERDLRKKNTPVTVDRGAFGEGNPNKKILNQRENTGSVEDINQRKIDQGLRDEGHQFFEPNAYFASAIGQKRLIEYMQAVTFRRKVLSNPEFAQKYVQGTQLGKNQVIIDTNNYKFINEGNDMLEGMQLADNVGGQYVVTKAVKNSLDRYQKFNTDEGTKAFLKTLDTVTNQWKKMALFSAGYHVRNLFGAMFNNYVGGMSTPSLLKYTGQASKEVVDAMKGAESELFLEFRKQGLASTNLSGVEFLRSTDPEKAIQKTITERSKSKKGKVVDRLKPWRAFETSREAGQMVDQINRFALFKWATEKGMTPKQAAAKVREVQFDYSKLSSFESNVAARMVPFYRWMRNNIPFQIKQFVNDPRKYQNVNKVRLNAQDAAGIDEDNVPDYMKNNFAIPVSGDGDGEGKGKMLGLNLPVSDLTKLSNPLKTIVDALSPLLKLPEEVALNRNFFYNKPIKEFAGQEKQYENPLNGNNVGVDQTLAYVLEQLTGQVGRGLSGFLQAPEDVNQDTKFRMPSFGISGLVKDYDADKSKYFEQRSQLQQLLDLIKMIEQQSGQDVPTINQLQAAR